MKNKKLISLSLALAIVAMAVVIGSLFSTKTTSANTVTVLEPQGSCTAVNVTNIQSQSIALGGGEKITVDWNFSAPGGDSCVKVEKFEVWIEVTRRTGRKNTRKIDASGTARQVSAEFTDVVDGIQSARAVVTAILANAKGEKTQTGL